MSQVPNFSLFTCILELEDLILRHTSHSECTDDTCKKCEQSDLEIAGAKTLKTKGAPASLDATLEMSPYSFVKLDETDLISLHQVNICKLYKSIEHSSLSESKLGRTMVDELN